MPLPLLALLPILVIMVVAFTFIYIISKSKQLAKEEIDKTPVYKTRCSGIIGSLHYRGPFIELRMYEDFLVVSYSKQMVFSYSSINVDIAKNFFRQGLAIHHLSQDYPSRIILAVYNMQEIKDYVLNRKKLIENAGNMI